MPKFLILRFSSIGDIVLSTPVIRCLKKQVPGAEVHYLTKKAFEPLLASNPYVDKLFLLENDLKPILTQLKKEKYDYIIDLHNNLRTARVKLSLGAKSYSFNKINKEKWLMVNLKINKLTEKHIVDRYLDTLNAFRVINDKSGLDYFIPEKDFISTDKLISTLNISTIDRNAFQYIAFAIGAQHFTKKLPVHKLISIINKIPFPVILMGGKEDQLIAEEVINSCKGNVYNACGIFTLNQSASIIKQAYKVISHDTGLMHIAAAFKKEIISVWGNTIPEFGMTPYLTAYKVVEVRGLSCRPCSKIGFSRCPKGHFKCMNDIDESEIIKEVLSIKS